MTKAQAERVEAMLLNAMEKVSKKAVTAEEVEALAAAARALAEIHRFSK